MFSTDPNKSLVFLAYDTLCRINIEPPDNKDGWGILKKAQEIAYQVEKTLSMYDETSELSDICRNYLPNVKYPISKMLFEFIHLNLLIAEKTDGLFDPTVGKVIKLWDFLADSPQIPEQETIRKLLKNVGYRHITLCPDEMSISFDCEGIHLDPGATGKGYALGKVAEFLRSENVSQAVLDFGGNLFTIGGKQDDPEAKPNPWKIALKDPNNPYDYIGTVPIRNCGVSTSSWYGHFFRKNEEIYHHIINPSNGMPVQLSMKSVSIISTSGFLTDALSTVFFLLGEKKGDEIINQIREESQETIEYVFVRDNNSIGFSEGSGFQKKKA